MSTVLWLSDGGAHTGFARVTHAIGDRLVEKYGHDIHCLATNYQGDYFPTKLKLYRPNSLVATDVFGQSRFIELLAKVEPDVVVMVNDPAIVIKQLFNNKWDTDRLLLQYRPILGYFPIDGHNHPPAWQVIDKVTNPVAMSRFGQAAMPSSKLVYHGVDSDIFYPVSAKRPITLTNGNTVTTKRECKEQFGYDPDGFLVLRVDRNSARKDFPASWKALLPVMHRHRDVQVHFHCQGANDMYGVDMRAMFSRDRETEKRFFLPDFLNTFIGWSEQDLNALYNASDLFLTNSRGEGFGLTIAEALACGVPVVAQNVTAIPEVVGPGGVLLEPEREITVPSGQDLWLSDIGAFTEAIEHLYTAGGVRRKLGAAGREHVTSTFSWDDAADKFHEYIEALARGTASTNEVLTHGPEVQDHQRPAESVHVG
jgi:glycosyltransferase involved in cell wall biosynthesis